MWQQQRHQTPPPRSPLKPLRQSLHAASTHRAPNKSKQDGDTPRTYRLASPPRTPPGRAARAAAAPCPPPQAGWWPRPSEPLLSRSGRSRAPATGPSLRTPWFRPMERGATGGARSNIGKGGRGGKGLRVTTHVLYVLHATNGVVRSLWVTTFAPVSSRINVLGAFTHTI